MGNDRIERIALKIADAHGCHTTILYGSRARGTATPASDARAHVRICRRPSGRRSSTSSSTAGSAARAT
jgi:predicted nucleotidyltransferase